MIVIERKARSTRAAVLLVDNRDETFENVGGINKREHDMLLADARWATVCDTHGNYVLHSTREIATSFMAVPEEWCGDCQEICDAKEEDT